MPRTDPGEGSVYPRKDGRWVAVLRWPQADGSSKRIPCTGATRAAALAARRARRLVEAAREERQTTPTVADWLADWQAAHAAGWAARTIRLYAQHVRLHVVPYLGAVRLADLTPQRVDTWQGELRAAGFAPPTIHNAWGLLRAAIRAAQRAGLVDRNVVALSTRPPVPLPRSAALTAAEAVRVLAVAEDTPWYPILLLALHTGLREGELLGLRWPDVDLVAGTLTVRTVLLGATAATFRLGAPKTAKSARTLPLPPLVLAALQAHRAAQPAFPAAPIPDLVFPSRDGTPTFPRNLYRAWLRFSKAAGVPMLTFHSIRHTAATLLLDANLPLPVVLAWFGWSSSAMLTRVYSHPRPADLATVGAALATRLLSGPDGNKKEAGISPLLPTTCRLKVGNHQPPAPRGRHESAPKWAKKPLK
jgi:integrase